MGGFHIPAHFHYGRSGRQVKTAQPKQMVAFVCNWRVAILTDCPDGIVRTEFDPKAFVSGVRELLTQGKSE